MRRNLLKLVDKFKFMPEKKEAIPGPVILNPFDILCSPQTGEKGQVPPIQEYLLIPSIMEAL